jgi:hypothetical protein
MFSWQWESFEEIIKSYAPMVNDHGPLAGPIHQFTIRRDRNLNLRMETEASASASASASAIEPQLPHPAGTVRNRRRHGDDQRRDDLPSVRYLSPEQISGWPKRPYPRQREHARVPRVHLRRSAQTDQRRRSPGPSG